MRFLTTTVATATAISAANPTQGASWGGCAESWLYTPLNLAINPSISSNATSTASPVISFS